MELELLKLFFPEELVAHFDITGSAIKQGKHGDYLEVEFTERNELPEGYSSEEYEAKDFVEKTIQDFPIRSHAAFLKLRRRRWRRRVCQPNPLPLLTLRSKLCCNSNLKVLKH